MYPGWHQVIPGALWCSLEQNRGFNLPEIPFIEEVAYVLHNPVAQFKDPLHTRTPQVEIAILQAYHLIDLGFFVDWKWRCTGRVEHF